MKHVWKILNVSSSNRTFMELKFTYRAVRNYQGVLIVPLWNWNDSDIKIGAKSLGSNRTFMELKYFTSIAVRVATTRSNRTFMELKFSRYGLVYQMLLF